MLTVHVEKRLGDFAVDASFVSESGATVLFGPSGAGKTSVINMIAGLLKPDRGRIVLDGDVLFDDGARTDVAVWRRRIGYVFQEGRLFPHLSIKHNLDYGRWMSGLAANEGVNVSLLFGAVSFIVGAFGGLVWIFSAEKAAQGSAPIGVAE